MFKNIRQPYRRLIFFILGVLLSALIGAAVYLAVTLTAEDVPHGAVVTNGPECAAIGVSILRRGGTAVEAAIAALFCEGIAMPQSMGLGGGFLMTFYDYEHRTAFSLNARETAPAGATEDMFHGDADLAQKGGLAVAVPGELQGYWTAYKEFGGKTPWRDLVMPTVELCEKGVQVTEYLERLFADQEENLKKDPMLKKTFIDPETGSTYKKGQFVKRPQLAKTLKLIAEGGADVLYNGELTENFVKDIQNKNGIITVDDMKNYKAEWQEPIKIDLPSKQILYTAPLPGSGVILGFILNILNNYLDTTQPNLIKNWQRIIESFKFGYGKRTELGDEKFNDLTGLIANLTSMDYALSVRKKISDNSTNQDPEYYGAKVVPPEDHGTAHISILAPNGDAVSVTSTINLYFGAGFMSETTGIILNDEMDDFSSPNINNSFGIPPSEANFIKPGKRPLSSMTPSIIVKDDGFPVLVIGAAGGTKITTSVAQIIMRNLWFGEGIQSAVSARRLHHQLTPMNITFEKPFENDLEFVDALARIGHTYEIASSGGFSAVTAIHRKDKKVVGATDPRRSGTIEIF